MRRFNFGRMVFALADHRQAGRKLLNHVSSGELKRVGLQT
jgi:hypothetical protein